MMRGKRRWLSHALILLVMSAISVLLSAQETGTEGEKELDALLPDDDAKPLIMLYCTTCHGAETTKQRISERRGDKNFWETLVRRMITLWNAKIPEEDIDPITTYFAKHFGPSAKAADTNKEKPEAEKKPNEKKPKG